ncbi:MAG: class I SAM-dependent methyltransferase [Pseudobacteriovorax sp.]|nr:class I SAM-dependent methyltransferase [Pseudobacteriovorax sp.]
MSDSSKQYRLIDSGHFQKLESVGPFRFVRPSPQAVWRPKLDEKHWKNVDAIYKRFPGGDGKWTVYNKKLPSAWVIDFEGQKFQLKRTDFGHLGVFVEQDSNWKKMRQLCEPGMSVLNLFGYTGGSTLAAAMGGAKVCHVDASKTSVAWARENADLNRLSDHPIRWIIDDVRKFVSREIKRGSTYHGIILDPPTFGRGSKNEVWKIEDHLPSLLDDLSRILYSDFRFVLLTSHSPGYTPLAMKNNLLEMLGDCEGSFELEEMSVPEYNSNRVLPSGASTLFIPTRS